ncbi:MAG: hypothetical protein CM15mV148_270 [uncultured marine virus]|nr:MAG: hypothetical protein CM15mV148_270 [uncultured marine virus]
MTNHIENIEDEDFIIRGLPSSENGEWTGRFTFPLYRKPLTDWTMKAMDRSCTFVR